MFLCGIAREHSLLGEGKLGTLQPPAADEAVNVLCQCYGKADQCSQSAGHEVELSVAFALTGCL